MFKTFIFKSCHCLLSVIITSIVLLNSFGLYGQPDTGLEKNWAGTWATAPQLVEPGNMPPSPGLSNNSLRQVVRVSIFDISVVHCVIWAMGLT